jgi:ABC-type nitrate/sulfonate/bicarbonate transport system ATPase subunit
MHYIQDVEHEIPFQISDEQNNIISSESSSFVLGRSGTGKSTILIAKLFKREKAPFFRADQGEEKACVRQMFLTMSPKLCQYVIDKLKRFETSTLRYIC